MLSLVMALAKKKTRFIHVDGADYRWVVSPDDGYLVLVVELARDPRSRLLVHTGYDDLLVPNRETGGHTLYPQTEITPGFVRRWILYALAHGWEPSTPGPEFRLRQRNGTFLD